MLLCGYSHNGVYSMMERAMVRIKSMPYRNEEPVMLRDNLNKVLKRSRSRVRLEFNSLKDIPLEVRRREAREPLFLTRYE